MNSPKQRLRKGKKPAESDIRKGKKKHPPKEPSVPTIVGIGASAGGLEALEGFFSNIQNPSDLAFVVIQHLPPKHTSIMDSLLRRFTQMDVHEIKNGAKIEKNHVYLAPPDRFVHIEGDVLRLVAFPKKNSGVNLPIDNFFHSLAENQGERAIGIIISGTGTDGTLGIRAIKETGGMIMAQEERQAKYPGMPASAIQTGLVDYALPVEKMPEQLLKYLHHPYIEQRKEEEKGPEGDFHNYLQKIFSLIRNKTGHDFTQYKQNTIRRRIERRMAIHQLSGIGDYYELILRQPSEVEILFKEFLISVTRFFRDPEAFSALEKKVIPSMLAKKEEDSSFRIWSPGCSTGEEAYSLAIVLVECMEKLKKRFTLQIFASDIDTEAIETGRKGTYPESIKADVSKERLSRYFVKDGNTYSLTKRIKECVVFALQDLVKDPPFSRIDLVSCRNVLIYMDQTLQKKILPLFHYALNDHGALFLGTSETVGDLAQLFSPIDTKWKIYERIGISRGAIEFPRFPANQPVARPMPVSPVQGIGMKVIVDKAIERFAPPSVLVNDKFDVLYLYGLVDRYLVLSSGEVSLNLLDIVREGLRRKLGSALAQAFKKNAAVRCEKVRVMSSEGLQVIDILIQPVNEPAQAQKLMLVIFTERVDASKQEKEAITAATTADTEAAALEQELKATKEYLQTTIEELQTSNEELRSTNEELQSTNEELETSKEELQSTNEELVTVNSELQNKIDELIQTKDDVNNLLGGTDIATIFLDTEMRIKRFTPASVKIFRLLKTDIGRSIRDITSRIPSLDIFKAANAVLKQLSMKAFEARTEQGTYYSVRALPYRTADNAVDGVVVTFLDITDLKQAERRLEETKLIAEGVVETIREAFIVLDPELNIQSANAKFYSLFKVHPKDTVNRRIYDIGNRQWDIPRLRNLLEKVVPTNAEIADYRVEHDFPGIGPKSMILHAHRIAQTEYVLLAIEDISGKKEKKSLPQRAQRTQR